VQNQKSSTQTPTIHSHKGTNIIQSF